jgi:hypothetical protein
VIKVNTAQRHIMPRGVMLNCKFKLAEKDKNRKKNKSVFLHQKSAQIDNADQLRNI